MSVAVQNFIKEQLDPAERYAFLMSVIHFTH